MLLNQKQLATKIGSSPKAIRRYLSETTKYLPYFIIHKDGQKLFGNFEIEFMSYVKREVSSNKTIVEAVENAIFTFYKVRLMACTYNEIEKENNNLREIIIKQQELITTLTDIKIKV